MIGFAADKFQRLLKQHGALLFFSVLALLLFYRLGSVAYLESSEARYAEISQEMLRSGDWLTPRLIFIKHFHKPPFTYWITAAGFRLFGFNNLAGRVFLVLAGLGVLLYTLLLARLLFHHRAAIHRAAVVILGSSPLFLGLSRTLTTDIYLAFFTVAAVYHHWRFHFGGRKAHFLLAAVFLGLGFFTKGPIPLIFFLLPWIAFRLLHRGSAQRAGSATWGFLFIFAAIALPWYLWAVSTTPGLLSYFLKFQTVDRYLTNVHHRSGPVYYYLFLLLAGMLYWATYFYFFLIKTLQRPRRLLDRPTELLLLLYTLLPFLFFSFSKSKLAAYLLPAFPFFALLTAYWLEEKFPGARRSFVAATSVNLLLGALLALALMFHPFELPTGLRPHSAFLVFAGTVLLILTITGAVHGFRAGPAERVLPYLTLWNLVFFFTAATVLPWIQQDLGGFERFAQEINRRKQPHSHVISYKTRLPSLTFYTGIRLIQMHPDRETRFEPDSSRESLRFYLPQEDTALLSHWQNDAADFLVIGHGDWRRIVKKFPEMDSLTDTLSSNRRYLLLWNGVHRRFSAELQSQAAQRN